MKIKIKQENYIVVSKHTIKRIKEHKEYSIPSCYFCLLRHSSSHLAHLGDGVIEHPSGIVSSLPDKLDLPGS